MCPEIFLYSSLLFAFSTNSLIRFGNKDFFAPLTVFQAHPVHDNHRCDYIERPAENQDFFLLNVSTAIFSCISCM